MIENIKKNITLMGGAEFQLLCDTYLTKSGYKEIVSLGTQSTTRKTTKGTPDTYFKKTNDKYVFVEYTTQTSGLFGKISSDIEKCLNESETRISMSLIEEIIYCHTSSNLTPAQDKSLIDKCKEQGIKLTLIGIDRLANDLYIYHQGIARDFLGISINTGQILTSDEFVKQYNQNSMAAPVNTKFILRTEELQKINDAFNTVDVVVLKGAPGNGKTRLALHYMNSRAIDNDEKKFCIRYNGISIYEDLKVCIDEPGKYFFFVDDADQLTELRHIIEYTYKKKNGYFIQILITVRDYAIENVMKQLRNRISPRIIKIDVFSNDEIIKLLESEFKIVNLKYQQRIIDISNGNPRLAMLSGKISASTNRLDSINDVSQLYAEYYESLLDNNQLLGNREMYITAAIIGFLNVIHLDNIKEIHPILENGNVSEEVFIDCVRKLHEMELVNIHGNKIVKFSDQSFANFMMKYVFFDKSFLSLSFIIEMSFHTNQARVVTSVSTLLNVFRNKDLYTFVKAEIKELWKKLSLETPPYFLEFVRSFYTLNPTEALLMMKNKIESEELVNFQIPNEIPSNLDQRYSAGNYIISMIGGFINTEHFPTAFELFLEYYSRRPDLYLDFFKAINLHFSINEDSSNVGFISQFTLLEKLIEASDNWNSKNVTLLFLYTANELLKFKFSAFLPGMKFHVVHMYDIELTASEQVKAYRKLIWDSLAIICQIDAYNERIRLLISEFSIVGWSSNKPVLEYDLPFIERIMKSHFPESLLSNSILADKIMKKARMANTEQTMDLSEYFQTRKFDIYNLLRNQGDIHDEESSFTKFINECDIDGFKSIIDICSEYESLKYGDNWYLKRGLESAFSKFSTNEHIVDAILYYIQKSSPLSVHPDNLVNTLITSMTIDEVFQIVNQSPSINRNIWMYSYFSVIPVKSIQEKHVQQLYSFLSEDSDKGITESSNRDVNFIEKYNKVDKYAYIRGCEILLNRIKNNRFMMNIYFSLLFNEYNNAPKEVIRKFNQNIELLEEIYFEMLLCDRIHDHSGKFLKEIYSRSPSIINRYITFLTDSANVIQADMGERNRSFFECSDYMEIYDKIFNSLLKSKKFPLISVPYFLKSILFSRNQEVSLDGKRENWICHNIDNFHNDMLKMRCLFSAITKMPNEKKKRYIELFIQKNESLEDFKQIYLLPQSFHYSHSPIPLYNEWKTYLESLLAVFSGYKWLGHKKYIEEEISKVNRDVKSAEIDEVLKD